MQITTLIIDDEPLARQRIRNLLTDRSQIEILDECRTGSEAISKIQEYTPDLIFLDIQMKDMTGFEVLEKLKISKKTLIVFVTAYDEFALKAFDYLAFDYNVAFYELKALGYDTRSLELLVELKRTAQYFAMNKAVPYGTFLSLQKSLNELKKDISFVKRIFDKYNFHIE